MIGATQARRWWRYGLAVLLCQALVACQSADSPERSTEERAAGPKVAAVPAPIPDNAPLVIAFGDSLYAGYRLGPQEGLAPQLQRELRSAGVVARVQNAGVSGDTSAAGRARLTFVLDSGKTKPALVLLGLGGNDMLRGIGPAETRTNLQWMVEELKRREIPVLLTGMLASPNMGRDYARAFNPIYPALAKQYGLAFDPFLMTGVVGRSDRMLGDGLHPNAAGVAVIVERLAPVVADALE